MWQPSLDFSENEKEYIVRAEILGVPKEDLEVNVDGQTVTISGRRDFEREEKTEEYFWREREAGRFVRSVQLPTGVDQSKVTATYQDGVMTLVRLFETDGRSVPDATLQVPGMQSLPARRVESGHAPGCDHARIV